MSRFLNSKYLQLEAYTPGEQPTDMKYIKLNTNESPFPPSSSVLEAVNAEQVGLLNLYPDPTCKKLKEGLAELFGVERENVFVSNGSDDILNFSFIYAITCVSRHIILNLIFRIFASFFTKKET